MSTTGRTWSTTASLNGDAQITAAQMLAELAAGHIVTAWESKHSFTTVIHATGRYGYVLTQVGSEGAIGARHRATTAAQLVADVDMMLMDGGRLTAGEDA